jgi:putative protease
MKLLVMPNELSSLEYFKDSSGFIIGIKGFSWFVPLEVTIEELRELVPKVREAGKQIFISLNKLMYNQDIPLLKEYLLVIEELSIDGIMYDDLSVLNLSKTLSLHTPLIWFGVHSFTSFYTANYWYDKGIKYGVLSTEITLDHIKEIKHNTNMSLMMYGYGHLPMFVSSRPLLSSYFKYIDSKKEDKFYYMYEEARKESYPTYEADNGTIILSSNVINTIKELPEIKDNVDYLILSSLHIPIDNFKLIYDDYVEALSDISDKNKLKEIDNLVTEHSRAKTDKGFLYKETVYRVKNDGER